MAHITYILRKPSEYDIWWWPSRLLFSNASDETIHSHVLCDYNALYIRIDKESILKRSAAKVLTYKESLQMNGELKIPWWQVTLYRPLFFHLSFGSF